MHRRTLLAGLVGVSLSGCIGNVPVSPPRADRTTVGEPIRIDVPPYHIDVNAAIRATDAESWAEDYLGEHMP